MFGIQPKDGQKKKKVKNVPWVEKHRPKFIKDVSYQDEVTRVLATSIKTGSVPHLLFYGPPGTGKTTTILAAANELFGPIKKDRVLELNASDERGINVVREKIKGFARYAVGNRSIDGYPCPPFKLIILDEADSMTTDAQAALRRTMETYSKVTRFCLICNYVSRIIEPLASRCAKFRFKPLPREPMLNRLHEICKKENIDTNEASLDTIIDVSGGDMRQAVNLLQNANSIYRKKLEPSHVLEISGVVPEFILENIWKAAKSRSFADVEAEVTNVMSHGYNTSFVLEQLLKMIVNSDEICDLRKAEICLEVGKADKCMADGADQYLQLLNVASCMSRNFSLNN